MPKSGNKSEWLSVQDSKGNPVRVLSKKSFNEFNSSLLGLGDINKESEAIDAVAAIFDLEGFTNFCKQIEPHLSVPLFLGEFLEWLLSDIKNEMIMDKYEKGVSLYCPLPFFVKFMGDGLLVLWKSSETSDIGRRNIIVSAHAICMHYKNSFFPKISPKVVAPPQILRCGLARGTVYSVGNGDDYVGSCINMAARLQKVSGLTFAFNRRGFNLEAPDSAKFFKEGVIVKKLDIRGIGQDELVAVLKKEYDALPSRDKKQFKDI